MIGAVPGDCGWRATRHNWRSAAAISRPAGSCRDCRLLLRRAASGLPGRQSARGFEVHSHRTDPRADEELALTAHAGGATVAVIAPADALNANAANALLKTLEEPRAGVTLILVASVPSRLPATVLSRCQRLQINAPSRTREPTLLERHRGAGSLEYRAGCDRRGPFEAVSSIRPRSRGWRRTPTARSCASWLALAGRSPLLAERWARGEQLRAAADLY